MAPRRANAAVASVARSPTSAAGHPVPRPVARIPASAAVWALARSAVPRATSAAGRNVAHLPKNAATTSAATKASTAVTACVRMSRVIRSARETGIAKQPSVLQELRVRAITGNAPPQILALVAITQEAVTYRLWQATAVTTNAKRIPATHDPLPRLTPEHR